MKNAVVIAHIPDKKLDFIIRQRDSHIFLLLLVAAENANFLDFGVQEPAQNCVAKRTGAASDQKCFAVEHYQFTLLYVPKLFGPSDFPAAGSPRPILERPAG